MADTLIKDVSDTAFMVATYRAIESERAGALFSDPLAGRLAGEHGRKIVASYPGSKFTEWFVVIRTCIIDRFIQEAIAGGVDTVLNLGAGLDTRPYRMALPESVRWIEVDYPHVIEWKENRLADEKPRCRLERIKLDLADVAARRALFSEIGSRSRKVLVLTEGVVLYFRQEEAASLADDLRSQPAFAYWVVDYFAPATYRYRRRATTRGMMANAPFRFEPSDFFGFFRDHGWITKEICYIAEEARRLGRPLPLPGIVKFWMKARSVFMSGARRNAMRQFAGYVLLEPVKAGGGNG